MSHIPIITRKTLTAPVTYYVRKDGSDLNTGLSNDAGGAFLTVQAAVDLVAGGLDMGNYQVTIQGGNGTYTEALSLKPYLGVLPPILQGSVATPSNVVLTYSSGAAVVSCSGTGNHWIVRGFKVISTGTCANGVLVDQNAIVNFYEMDFGACISAQVSVQRGGIVQFLGNYTISGGAAYHIYASSNGCVQGAGLTVTLSGTPAFSTAFLACEAGSSAQLTAFTFSGAATGVRYHSGSNSIINVGVGDESYFPGDTAGIRITGGFYNTLSAAGTGRETLTEARTYYVRTDGDDANTGLVDSAAGAFLTIQKAVDTVASVDMGPYSVTVQVRGGTRTDGVVLRLCVGTQIPLLIVDTTTPSNCVISTTGTCITNSGPQAWYVRGFKFTSSAGNCVLCNRGAAVLLQNVEFGACPAGQHMWAQWSSSIEIYGSYTISGNANIHALAQYGGAIIVGTAVTITVSGTPTFGRFAQADANGLVTYSGATFSGGALGTRYLVTQNSTVIGNGGNFPGSVAGSVASSGVYVG